MTVSGLIGSWADDAWGGVRVEVVDRVRPVGAAGRGCVLVRVHGALTGVTASELATALAGVGAFLSTDAPPAAHHGTALHH